MTNIISKFNLLLLLTYFNIKQAFAQDSAIDTLAESIETDFLGGRWRIIFVAVAILAVGFLFITGRLAWYWCVGILIGVMLIAGAIPIAEWLFEIFEG